MFRTCDEFGQFLIAALFAPPVWEKPVSALDFGAERQQMGRNN